MEDQGEDVAEDEDPGVESGLEEGELWAEFNDDMLEGEVDAGGDEGGSDDEAADLRLEAAGVVGVVVHDQAADVADGFGEGAQAEGDHEGPGLEADSLDQVDEEADAEEGAEEGVGAQRGCVAVDGLVDGAVDVDIAAVLGGVEGGGEDAAVGSVGLRAGRHVLIVGWCVAGMVREEGRSRCQRGATADVWG